MGAVAAHRMSQRGGLARKMLFRKLDPALINSTDPLSGVDSKAANLLTGSSWAAVGLSPRAFG